MNRSALLPFLLAVLGLAACGNDDAKAFEGTWSVSGTQAVSCDPTPQDSSQDVEGEQSILPGTDSDLVLPTADGCSIKFNVSGKVATAVSGQTCTEVTSTGQITVPVDATMTLSDDGRSISISITATAASGDEVCTETTEVSGTLASAAE